jgi:hypothetical protein
MLKQTSRIVFRGAVVLAAVVGISCAVLVVRERHTLALLVSGASARA